MSNHRTLLPPDHPDAPKYWMNEISGVLRPAVEAYLNGARLDRAQLGAMKAYLRQWVNSPVWGGKGLEQLRRQVAEIQTQADIERAISAGIEIGIDPL